MAAACLAAGRSPQSVTLLAVTKTCSAQAVREAWAAGQRAFGESYVQEALAKMDELSELPIEWHYIGPIQSNKTRSIAERFDWVHGIDRLGIAQRLSLQRPAHLPPLQVCVQVNTGGEASKRGVEPSRALALASEVAALPGLRLRGFMTIPSPSEDSDEQRRQFRILGRILDQARSAGVDVETLSMGMSHDLESAILEGATIVRVGTAIFGMRPKGEKA